MTLLLKLTQTGEFFFTKLQVLYKQHKEGIPLRKIRYRFFQAIAFTVICLFAFLGAVFFWLAAADRSLTLALILLFAIVEIIAVAWLFRSVRDWTTGRLIWDNQILQIPVAKLDGVLLNDMQMVVSGFGILLDSKVIRFNQEGIKLLSVKIGSDHIGLRYGAGENIHEAMLLFQPPGKERLLKIVEAFRFETGVEPELGDDIDVLIEDS